MTDDWDTPWSNPHPIWHRHVGVTLGPISQNPKKYKKGLKMEECILNGVVLKNFW
jgi:hypothetical protein